jgi:flagellar hook-associated protein 1 FlgK
MGRVDELASRLIWEVNRLHSTGDPGSGYARLTGSLAFAPLDRARAMNDPQNRSIANLPFEPVNGGFVVRVRQTSTGAITTVRIDVDLDGLTNAGQPGTGDDTTPEQLRAAIDGVAGVSARYTPDGKLDVRGDDGFTFSFGDDSSGVLASLGMNAFFTGTDSTDIAVRSDLVSEPARLAAARYVNNQLVENGTALLIAGVQDAPIEALEGRSLGAMWRDAVQGVGGDAAGARSAAEAASLVRESLEAQRAAVSGVSLDEESVNLLQYQRQYQASARLISVVDEMTQTLISLV